MYYIPHTIPSFAVVPLLGEQLLSINMTVYMDFFKNAASYLVTEHFLKFSCCNFSVAIS